MNLSRRRFLQGAGGCAAALVLAGAIDRTGMKVSASGSFAGNPDRMGMLTDTTMCVGCRICELGCAEAHGLPKPDVADRTVFKAIRRPTADAFTVVNLYESTGGVQVYRKIQCMHCDEPACVSACPAAAFQKTAEGPVTYNRDLCIGCRYCMTACPFGVPAFEWDSPKPFIRKCTMCYANAVRVGGTPACAEVCPPKATVFGKRSDLLALATQRINANPGKYVNHIYGQSEAGGTGWLYLSAVPFEQMAFPAGIGTTPLSEYTRDWLTAVPAILVLWPTLLVGIHQLIKHHDKIAGEVVAGPRKVRPI